MQARKMILVCAVLLAMVMVSSASASVVQIQLVGVNLKYNGTNITDSNNAGPSPLASATFFVDGVQVGMADVTGVTLDLYIPDVKYIPVIGGIVDMPSTSSGSLLLGLGDGESLSLVLDSVSVWYSYYTFPSFTLRFAGVASSSTIVSQDLPDGISLVEPVGVSFTTQINQFTTDGSYVTSFTSAGVGEIQHVPEPAAMSLLAIGGLALIVRRRKR